MLLCSYRCRRRLHVLIEAHGLAAERLHDDDTTVPILAKGKIDTARIWTYVRDDRPFGAKPPPAALYFASRDRRQDLPDQQCRRTGIARFALGRKSWLFAGSDRGADHAAFMATLIDTAKLNDIDPQAWLADARCRIADIPVSGVEELPPLNWKTQSARLAA